MQGLWIKRALLCCLTSIVSWAKVKAFTLQIFIHANPTKIFILPELKLLYQVIKVLYIKKFRSF